MAAKKTKIGNQKSKVGYRFTIQIDEEFSGEVAAQLLREAARAALKHQAAGSGALTIALSGDETLQTLNQQYLGHNYPTDVLSFPSDADDPDSGGRYFGDIAISFPRAVAQAQAGGHALEAELQLLTVHGVLHLLGHDHAEPAEKDRMWQAQSEILTILSSEIDGPANE
jgi:probable rRNA maturation factor